MPLMRTTIDEWIASPDAMAEQRATSYNGRDRGDGYDVRAFRSRASGRYIVVVDYVYGRGGRSVYTADDIAGAGAVGRPGYTPGSAPGAYRMVRDASRLAELRDMESETPVACPICHGTHDLTDGDRAGARNTSEAVATAHYREEVLARSARPFVMPVAAMRSPRRNGKPTPPRSNVSGYSDFASAARYGRIPTGYERRGMPVQWRGEWFVPVWRGSFSRPEWAALVGRRGEIALEGVGAVTSVTG